MSAPFSLSPTPDAVACSNATGYDFRAGVPPTVAQLQRMCGQDDCIQEVNSRLLRPYYGPSPDEREQREMDEFAYPVVDFCYYYRAPGAPCPADFLSQFMKDLHDLVASCKAKSGFPFSLSNTTAPVTSMCGIDECENVVRRLYAKPYIRSCEPMLDESGQTPSAYEPVIAQWVQPFIDTCGVSGSPMWYQPIRFFDPGSIKYVYLPGPVPENTTTTTAPSTAPPTAPPIRTPAPTDPPPRPAETTPNATTSSPILASARPATVTSTLEETVSDTPTPTRTAARNEIALPDVSIAPKNQTHGSQSESTSTPALPHVSEPTIRGTTVPAPSLETASASKKPILWSVLPSVAATVGILILAFVFLYRRRRLRTATALKHDDMYSTMAETPRTDAALATDHAIPVMQLEELHILGGGATGVVYLVRDRQNAKRLLASKRLHQNHKEFEVDAFVAELSLAASLKHPRIVSFVGISGLHKSDIQGVFEYMPGGDLCRYLSTQPPLDPTCHSWNAEKLQIAIDIADALAYIHTLTPMPVVHRDLKSRNVLLTNDKRAKLGDFGVSRPASTAGSMTTGIGTSRWVAPEVILGGGEYSTECDIYSFGVVLTELDTHRLPFSELVNLSGDPLADFVILEMVATGRCQPSLSATCPPPIRDLALRCLSFGPTSRPTAFDVLSALREIQESVMWAPRNHVGFGSM